MKSWTVNLTPTHIITIGHCPDPNERVLGMYEMVEDEDVAKQKVLQAVKNHEWGKSFGYRSKLSSSWIFCYTAHYPRWECEGDGFVNHHSVESVVELLGIDFYPTNIDDCWLTKG